ncbi:hypothetical protein HCG69_04980 [Bacteroides sp. K03]|uniref:class I mannose-6-phosphate isomerase n=1 Tax=unclassified Bacteroides TaxID=2646097 RepID=UPI001C8BBC68|nr:MULTISPECIES: class I mannose-6-phosphate isomerase [unclassified Bacteroides]MBX9187441.1 hypothetical protein [Bacteroides sp. K03]
MKSLRKTSQILLPMQKEKNLTAGSYDIYPVHSIAENQIFVGYRKLAEAIRNERNVIIDGYAGIFFDEIKTRLNEVLAELDVEVTWWNIDAALKTEEEINDLVTPYLGGDDPIFGKRCDLELKDLFCIGKLSKIHPDSSASLNILIGCGAALAGWKGKLIYIDIPKNEIQFRARAGKVTNLGVTKVVAPKVMYKRFYFVDWVLLNKHKKNIFPDIDVMVDGQHLDTITWMQGNTLREGLKVMGQAGFRVRPWFEPGAWGGQWIKEHIEGLEKEVPNYAWSFELIVPENGLLFESSGNMLEVSFDSLMYVAGENVVGTDCYNEYGDEFPIRMDYLDNFDGGNLSIQCHPRKEYIQKNFGEVLTQEETYYITDCKDNAVVYLGFQDNIEPAEFEKALTKSFVENTPLEVDRYVQSLPAKKHELFLIPPGTLHSSGRNNLVLEISTTPYIFTFKMYDWLALDLDGTPRPLNIKRGMENLYFDRCGEKVRNEYVSKPALLEKGKDWELYHLPTHPNHSYDVHRVHFKSEVTLNTAGKCHVLNLVEGDFIYIEISGQKRVRLNYAETYVISAAAGDYKLSCGSQREAMVVKAFMK